jgi:large subunit ribosomal protein L15
MPAKRRKKNSRQHGSTTHGWGARKKHRGSGNRGGMGMAGTGKRCDGKKTMIWKDVNYFGKHGFKKKGQIIEVCAINIENLQSKLTSLVADNKVKKEGDSFIVDLSSLGYNKLLGTGAVEYKMKITVDMASVNAVGKVKEKGGEVITKNEASE